MKKHLITLSIAMAIAALAGSAAFAQEQVEVSNVPQDPSFYPPGSPATFYSPITTTGGALWINTGSGPALYAIDQDVNVQLNVNDPFASPAGWTTIATFLNSDGTATGDETFWNYPAPQPFSYPGMFFCGNAKETSLPGIPGTSSYDGPYNNPYNMELYIWTGNYTTYAAAQAAAAAHTPGAYAADSGVFLQSVAYVAGGPPPIPYGLTDMPATILTQNPVALMPGDANGDGKVDINDLTIVLAHYNQTLGPGSWAEGDFTGSGKVDINDLTIVLANYNHTSGAGSLAAVPEPTGVALLACAGLAVLACAARTGLRRGGRE